MNPHIARRAAAALALAALLSGMPAAASPAAAAAPVIDRVRVDSETNSVSPKAAIASCPPGTQVVGTGARVIGGLGQVVMEGIIPNTGLTNVTVTAREDQDGFSGNWSVVAIAFCTAPQPFLERFDYFGGPSPDRSLLVTGACPGRQVLGLGFQINGGNGQVTVESLNFAPHLVAIEDQDNHPFPWSATLFVICGNPTFSHRVVSDVTEFNSSSKSLIVHCPAGEKVMATSFSLVQGNGQARVDDMFTSVTTPGDLRVAAKEDQDGHPGVWSLRPFARCAGA